MTVKIREKRRIVVTRCHNVVDRPMLAVLWVALVLVLLCCSSVEGFVCFTRRTTTMTTQLMTNNSRRSDTSSMLWSMSVSSPESGISSSATTNSQTQQQKPAVVTIRVCSGADCRVDGSTDCLRMIQTQCKRKLGGNNSDKDAPSVSQLRDNNQIKVKSVPCLGPCGDGPNVVLNLSLEGENDDRNGKRVVNRELQDIMKDMNGGNGPKSLVPAEPFGANTAGVYQVRTTQTAATIVNVAIQTLTRDGDGDELPLSQLIEDESKMTSKNEQVTVTRQWYDRPRNERLVLQRFMHICILVGVSSKYNEDGGDSLPSSAWMIAGILWILSNLIMKENLLEQAWNKLNKKIKS